MNHNEAEKKAKRKAYMQAWWLKNKESATIKHKEWLEANKDKVKAYTKKYKSNRSELQRKKDNDASRQWSINNKDRVKKNRDSWNHKHKDRVQARRNRWSAKNPEKAAAIKKSSLNRWRENNKQHIRNYSRKRAQDPIRRVAQNISRHIRKSLSYLNSKKNSKTQSILGCTYAEFKLYLESKFEPWMSWDNYGKYNGTINFGWDLDHIMPIVTAKSADDVMRLNHYTNYQPLCSYTNRHIKRHKID